MVFALVTQLLAVGLGCSACSVVEPSATPAKAPTVLASVAVASDSACRVLDVKLDKTVSVVFPDRATCGAGLTLIRGGTPSGDPKGGVVTILIRILNHAAVTAQEPVRLTLAPGGVQIVGKGTPSNVTAVSPDSTLAGGVALWRIGPAAVLAAGDSTIVDTIKIGFVSPAKEAKLTFGLDATTVIVNPVPAVPPDSTPAWFQNDSSYLNNGLGALKRVVVVRFDPTATQAERQAAVDSVGGTVIGGTKLVTNDGFYLVYVNSATTEDALFSVIATLERQPKVHMAATEVRKRRFSLRPNDGPGWQKSDWVLTRAVGGGTNAPMERIAAPMAWGCTTGDSGVEIGIIDHGFDSTDVSENIRGSFIPRNLLDTLPNHTPNWHGYHVAQLLGAVGNNGIGTSGVMWHVGLRLQDDFVGTSYRQEAAFIDRMVTSHGIRLINISEGNEFHTTDRARDSLNAAMAVAPVVEEMNLLSDAVRPLLIVAVGDSAIDARFSTRGALAIGVQAPGYVLGVGAINFFPVNDSLTAWANIGLVGSRSNTGNFVDVYAPGSDSLPNPDGGWENFNATSMAAPIVSGIAGLLLSSNPSMGVPDLRQKIIDGAMAGKTKVGDANASTPRYVVNAWESLKAASHAPGVRGVGLCGNRLFVNASGGLVVERSSENDLETIWPSGVDPSPWTVEPFHGGRRVGVYLNNTTGDGFRDLVLNNSTWSAVTLPTIEPDPASGAWFSAIGVTHDGDSTAIVDAEDVPCILSGPDPYRSWCFSPSGNYQQTLSLGDLLDYPTPGRILGQKPRAIIGASGWQPIRQSRNDGTPWQTADSVPTVAGVTGFPQVYPSASSDRVYLVMSRQTATVDAFGEWRPCSDQVPSPNCQKRDFLWHSKSLSASVYAVPWASGNVDSLWSVSDSGIGGLGTSEEGRELANMRQRSETVMWLTYDSYVEPRVVSQAYGTALSYVSPLTGALIRSYANLGSIAFGTMSAVKKGDQSALMLPRRPSDDRVLRPPGWAALLRRPGIRPRQ